jgi:hypothetical protein
MSYDLYFYKKTTSPISEEDLRSYLRSHLVKPDPGNEDQWWYQNDDTEVYYSFNFTRSEDPGEDIALNQSFGDFLNTDFTFNINFLRPDFFGLDAFAFVQKFIDELDLFVQNPQGGSEWPYKPEHGDLYNDWSISNSGICRHHFNTMGAYYYPKKKANATWRYNSYRKTLQEQLGNGYFVPKMFFFKRKSDNKVITLASWTEHIPNVFPLADYYYLTRKHQKLFRTVTENGLISYDTLVNGFRIYFDEVDYEDCYIIHPQHAREAKGSFQKVKFEHSLDEFERIEIEKLFTCHPEID